jgi:hypothetical protein
MSTAREGTFTKLSAIAGVIGVVVAVAAGAHWGPFSSASTPSPTSSFTPAPTPSSIPSTPSTSDPTATSAATAVQAPVAPSSQPAAPQYSQVAFAVLCDNQNAQTNFNNCSGDNAAVRIGQNAYDFSSDVYVGDSLGTALSFPGSTCRSLSLRFAVNPQSLPPATFRLTVTVVESQGPPQSATIGPNQLGTLNASLSSGPWEIQTLDNYGWSVGLYMDGSGSCSTGTGS